MEGERAVEEVLRIHILSCGQMAFGEFMHTMQTAFTFSPGGLLFLTVQCSYKELCSL